MNYAWLFVEYRPGLSAGISGTAFDDNVSVASSVPGTEDPLPSQRNVATADNGAMERSVRQYYPKNLINL